MVFGIDPRMSHAFGNEFAQGFIDAFSSGSGSLGKRFSSGLDHMAMEIENIGIKFLRQSVLRAVPWIVGAAAATVGTPLVVHYLYKKTLHNLGKPRLAQKVRYVDTWSRIKNTTISLTSHALGCLISGVKASTLTLFVGFTGSGLIDTYYINRGWVKNVRTDQGWTTNVMTDLWAQLANYAGLKQRGFWYGIFGGTVYPTHLAKDFLTVAIGVGVVAASVQLGALVFQSLKKEKEVKPIFSAQLEKRIDEIAESAKNIRRNGGYMQNLLLYGPGGTGKTMVAERIAKKSGMNFIMMSGADLAQYIKRGEHVTELNKMFDEAKKSHYPTILFIDEFESIGGDRGKFDRSELFELSNAFLNQTGSPSKKVMLITTTNRPKDLDDAILNRMDHRIEIGPPALRERARIITAYLPQFTTLQERQELFTDKWVQQVAQKTLGFTGRTLSKMLNCINSKRATTRDNTLTRAIVDDVVNIFIDQESKQQKKRFSFLRRFFGW